jgi:two-component system phosphate regulon sensor histidine kinase PhoR
MRWRQAGEALPDGVVILDAQNRIEWCNEGAGRHFGLDLRADPGRPVTNLVRQPEFAAYIEAEDYAHAIPLRSEHGGGLVLSVQVIPYGEAQKLLLSRDITRLEKVETMRRDFVANVSHELKTPVTVLSGFVETLSDESFPMSPAQRGRYLAMMAEQAKRMQRLVEDLLTLSALESSATPAEERPIELLPFVERLADEARALSGGRHRVESEVESDGQLLGSAAELHSALSNLVSNAVRYTPDGGSVRLAWRVVDGSGVFSVSDSGIGIEARHIPRLTERFYRVDSGRSRETGGTGLGLAIVKHALTRHQAALDVVSEPGRGSTFSAVFPPGRVLPRGEKKQAA